MFPVSTSQHPRLIYRSLADGDRLCSKAESVCAGIADLKRMNNATLAALEQIEEQLRIRLAANPASDGNAPARQVADLADELSRCRSVDTNRQAPVDDPQKQSAT